MLSINSRIVRRRVAAALVALGCLAGTAAHAAPKQTLEDIQIGERAGTIRIALICSSRCRLAPDAAGGFRLEGVETSLNVDLAARSALVRWLRIAPRDGDSILTVEPAVAIDRAAIITCNSNTEPAPCIELTFASASQPVTPASQPAANAPVRLAPQEAPALRAAPPPRPAIRDLAPEAGKEAKLDDIPFLGAAVMDVRPTLRETPGSDVFAAPKFSPPERLAPPATQPQRPQQRSDARPLMIAPDRPQALASMPFDLREEVRMILGKSLDADACAQAKGRLAVDAWALESMIDLAFCKAAAGELRAADNDFARLLAYTPDNYQALVGRGLIAIAGGDENLGRKYFQEALNALPPVAESNRIVGAMGRF